MHDSTLDLFEKVGIDANDIEALSAYYEVTCDYYMQEFLGLEDLLDWETQFYTETVETLSKNLMRKQEYA